MSAETARSPTEELTGARVLAELSHGDAAQRECWRIVAQADVLERAEHVTDDERARGGGNQGVHGDRVLPTFMRDNISLNEATMAIRRDELRKTDFSDVSSGRRLAPVHPGYVLLKDFIEPMGISRYRVAKNANVPQRRIDLMCRGDSAVSADMALRLARLFGTTPEFWISLQAQYDLEVAERAIGKEIARAVVPLAA